MKFHSKFKPPTALDAFSIISIAELITSGPIPSPLNVAILNVSLISLTYFIT